LKKRVFTILIFLLAITLIFTNRFIRNTEEEKDDAIKIVTSFYPIYITTLNVTDSAKNVEVINLTNKQDGCLHDYYLLPEDMIALEEADVFIVNGEGMEEFLDKVIKNYPNLKIINASDGVDIIKCEHESHDGHNEEYEEINSHTWLSVENNIKQTQNILNGLISLDKNNSKIYSDNAGNYVLKLKELKEQFNDLNGKKVITTNETFAYFLDELNIDVGLVLEDVIGTNPNTYDIANAIEKIKELNASAIIVDLNQENNYYKTIEEETNIKTITLNPVTSGENSKEEYINVMKENIKLMESL